MSDNWVVQNLENALETWNEKLAEIWQLITTTPQDFKGGGIWGVIVNINGAVQSIGLALLVLFFVAGMVKTCGSFTEVKKPEHALKLFVRFAIAKGAGESVETALNYVMSYEDYTRNGVIDINVKSLGENPHSMLTTDKQTLKRIIDNALKENEDKAVIELPDTINNTSVTYAYVQSQTGSKNNLLFAAMIVIAVIVLIYYKKKTKAKEEQKLRQKQLQYDYSEVISKLTLLLGAGMTVRRAWEKMIEDYMRKKKSAKDERIVYEQMYITDCQIKSGISEYKAYEEFGHRCQTREYLKLASLLQTNIKKGTKELKELLYQESYDAFEQRKSLAVKKGEEAATRLLMPMFMLLIVVMIIVMVPAVISFQV